MAVQRQSWSVTVVDEFASQDLAPLVSKLNQSIQSNVQCHHKSILTQLSKIHEKVSTSHKISQQCDVLVDGDIIKTIVKLLDSTKNAKIIHRCFELLQTVTLHANKSHYVTIEYVSMLCFVFKFLLQLIVYNLNNNLYTV